MKPTDEQNLKLWFHFILVVLILYKEVKLILLLTLCEQSARQSRNLRSPLTNFPNPQYIYCRVRLKERVNSHILETGSNFPREAIQHRVTDIKDFTTRYLKNIQQGQTPLQALYLNFFYFSLQRESAIVHSLVFFRLRRQSRRKALVLNVVRQSKRWREWGQVYVTSP